MEWLDGNKIQIIPPKRPKKLTGTRFATILGLNPWSTPFEIWCEVTRTYQKPFEDTIYTIAGKTIEPKQAEYMKQTYFMSNLVTPTDIWGKDYFRQTYGDFFRESPVLGGMYYALQAALYAYLLGVDEVIMVASFLEPKDYDNPEKFVCSGENTITRPFKVSERYPDFEKKYVKPALKWWKDYVESGISPAFDERKDAEILKALRTNNLSPETDMAALVKEAEDLKDTMERILAHEGIPDMEKRYKVVTDMIKKAAIAQFRDGDKKVSIAGSAYNWEVSRTSTTKIDKDAMKADGILAKYTTTEDSYRISPKIIKEG